MSEEKRSFRSNCGGSDATWCARTSAGVKPADRVPTWFVDVRGLGLNLRGGNSVAQRTRGRGVVKFFALVAGAVAAALVVLIAGLVLPQRWLYFHVLARVRNFYEWLPLWTSNRITI